MCIDALSGLWHSVLIRLKLFRAALRRLKLIFEVPTTVFHVLSFSTKLLGCIISIFSVVFTVLPWMLCYGMLRYVSWLMNHSHYAQCPRWYHEYESGLVFTRPLFYVAIIPFLENRILHIIEFSKRCKRQKLSHAFKLALHKFMHTDGPQSIIQITCLSEKNSPGNDFKWATLSFKTF